MATAQVKMKVPPPREATPTEHEGEKDASTSTLTRRRSYKRRFSSESAVSLSSFTSVGSINNDGPIVEVGNLRFLRDEEMNDGRPSILG